MSKKLITDDLLRDLRREVSFHATCLDALAHVRPTDRLAVLERLLANVRRELKNV